MAPAKRVTYADKTQTAPYDATKANGADYQELKDTANDHADKLDVLYGVEANYADTGFPGGTVLEFVAWVYANAGGPGVQVPGKVGAVTPTPGAGTMSLAFAAVDGATSYIAKYRSAGIGSYVTGATGSASPLVITGLSNALKDFTVTAHNSAGDGEASNVVQATPGVVPPKFPRIIYEGNSLIAASEYPRSPAFTVQSRIPQTWGFNNVATSGEYIGPGPGGIDQINSQFATQVLPLINPATDSRVLLILQEGTNNPTGFLQGVLAYKAKIQQHNAQVGAVPITLILHTIPPNTNGANQASLQQLIDNNAALRANPAQYCDVLVDLSLNTKVGRFGNPQNPNDPLFSSNNLTYYPDRTHWADDAPKVVGFQDLDAIAYVLNGTPMPDPSNYPPAEPFPGTVITWANTLNAITGADGKIYPAPATGQYTGAGRSLVVFTAGSGLRGFVEYTTVSTHVGLFGISSVYTPASGSIAWLPSALLGSHLIKNGGLAAAGPGFAAADRFRIEVYADRLEYFKNGQPLHTDNTAPSFPCFPVAILDDADYGTASNFDHCYQG